MPTGVAIRDVRDQLFDAAERVLLRSGPNTLTSRAVTTEAGCAKGVFRDELRTRLRAIRPPGVPLLTEGKTMIAGYLRAEQDLRRISAGADVDLLALTLLGSGHLLRGKRFAGARAAAVP